MAHTRPYPISTHPYGYLQKHDPKLLAQNARSQAAVGMHQVPDLSDQDLKLSILFTSK